ncbi:hypothetical protein BJ912DRAFT_1063227 [Pholiota molesta]|nr:hypothetical protein BJ912DRAFT_1063227 [Pholiota molesta]
MTLSTPFKRSRNDENANISRSTPARARDPFRTPLRSISQSQPNVTPANLPQASSTHNSFVFLDGSTPVPKRRRFAKDIQPSEHKDLIRKRQEAEEQKAKMATEQAAKDREMHEQYQRDLLTSQVNRVLQYIEDVGFSSVYHFLHVFFSNREHSHSSKVSQPPY